MKYKKILTWTCTAALFLTGCTTDTASNGGWMDDSNAVRIQASAGSTLTRSNPIDESKQTGFNRGDKISVRNRNITVNYTFDGEIWQPVDNDKYLVWDKNDLKFEAYYPCDGKNDFSVGYIKKDQSTPEALAQSDYMNITSNNLTEIPSDKHLTLELKRQTARLILRIQHFNDEFSKGVKVTELGIGCPENTNEGGSWESIRPYQQNGDGGVGTTYTALVIPGKRRVVITLLNPGKPGIDDLELETGELKAGYSYTYNLIVGKNKVTVGGVTVAEWKTGNTLQGGVAEEEDLTPYVTMTAAKTQTFKMTCKGNYTLPEDLEYSVNNGTWQKVEANQGVNFGGDLGSLRLRGICPNGTATDWKNYSTITFSDENVKVECSGDIRTLIDYTAYDAVATENSSFISLFNGCSVLTSAPKLHATALKESCYRQMFEGCTSLEQAPDLPATELKTLCYYSMFSGCTSLTQAPKLPATKLAHSCYCAMFEGCTSLDKAPDLQATTLMPSCYSRMFKGCIALTRAPELKAMKLENGCYKSMFEGCTALADAPELPATTLDYNCYISMFSGCKSLETAPVLPAKKLTDWCYQLMFKDCTKLKSVTMLATEDGYNALSSWLDDAGTEAENRTLKVYNKEAYKDIVTDIPDIWKIGAKNCTVLDQEGYAITTTE